MISHRPLVVALLYATAFSQTPAIVCPPGRYFESNGCATCAPGSVTDTFDLPGALLCDPCGAGTFSADPTVECADCRPGKYSGGGASGCQECAPGKFGSEYSQKTEKSSCEYCPPGSTTDTLDMASATACTICGTGLYSPSSTISCIDCPVGSITDTFGPGATTCEVCPPGQFSTASTVPCIGCPVGKYQSADTNNGCLTCPPGSVTDTLTEQGASTCRECSPGRFSSVPSIPCKACTAGYFSGLAAKACTGCVPGKFSRVASSEDDSNCLECPRGSVTDRLKEPGSTSCTACKKGRFSPNSDTACSLCSTGRFCEISACPYCVGCKLGYFHSMIGSSSETDCLECTPGSVTDTLGDEGGSSCLPCNKGRFSSAPSSACAGCPVGRFGTIIAARTSRDCIVCPAGSVTDTLGLPGGSSCDTCGAGRFSGSAASSCTNCPRGRFSTGEEPAVECEKCVSGRYGIVEAAKSGDTCIDCPSGSYTNTLVRSGASSCTACAIGKYSPGSSVMCISCDAGAVTNTPNSTGANQCFPCKAGKYSRVQDFSCIVCSVGRYTSSAAAVDCEACTLGSVTNTLRQPGASECKKCTVGKYSTSPTKSCEECEPGKVVARTGSDSKEDCIFCPSGQYQPASGRMSCNKCAAGKFGTGADPIEEATQCSNCTGGRFQQKTGQSFCTMCDVGQYQPLYGSTACRTCSREHLIGDYYIKQAGVCKVCPVTADISASIALPVVFALVFVRASHAMTDKQYATNTNAQTLAAVLTLLTSASQVMVLIAEYVRWPAAGPLGEFFGVISLINLKIDSLPADCLGLSKPNLVLCTLYGIPATFGFVNLAVFLFFVGVKKMPKDQALRQCKAAFALSMVWFYLTTLSTSYGWMTCHPKGDDFVSVYDESIKCFSSDAKWTLMFAGSVPALVFYQFAMPYYIYQNFEEMSFLVSPLRREWQQRWLKYELAYRCCLVVLRALLHEWAHLQGVFMMAGVLGYHYALWSRLPYNYRVVTKFNGALPYCVVLCASMQVLAICVGFLFNASIEMKPGLDVFFIVLFVCWCWAASWYCWKQYRSAAIKVDTLDREKARQLNEIKWDPAFTMATNIKLFKFLIAVFTIVGCLSLRSGVVDSSAMHILFGILCLGGMWYIWFKQIFVLNGMQRVFDPNCYPDLGAPKAGFTVNSLKAALDQASMPSQDEVQPAELASPAAGQLKVTNVDGTPQEGTPQEPAVPTLTVATVLATPDKGGLLTPSPRKHATHTAEYMFEANARILRKYYARHNPAKVQDVDLILEEYTVAELVASLRDRYDDIPALEGL